MDSEDRWEHAERGGTVSGRIVLAGTGFMVSATVWALLGFVQLERQNLTLAWLDLALVVLHLVVGPLILRRVRVAWAAGLALAALSLVACVFNGYYLAVIADGVSGLLLFLSRDDFQPDETEPSDRQIS